ncbi:hypothetical protein ACJ73_07328 [Blastomyces percursus]|uniref:Uncharacterized protein n=1 Tax=Blastomyces percursus TaxID=1658174 RepID=A0A1J9PYC0_9EURO|nr:hypothetical protein ACJ73_07328 [Blastomyces percursus]
MSNSIFFQLQLWWDTSAVNVLLPPRKRPATDAARPDTSPVTAHLPDPETTTTAVATPVEELLAARNATSAARSGTSPVTALRAEVTDPVVTAVLVVMAAAMVAAASRLAIRAAATAIWLATALRVKSATTVRSI